MSGSTARDLAWERWADLGQRIVRADAALAALHATADTNASRERLATKRAGVTKALRLWEDCDKPGPLRGAVSVYAEALDKAAADAALANDGSQAGLLLVKDYVRSC